MKSIQSDTQFKQALSDLTVEQQRNVARLFIEQVISLTDNPRVSNSLAVCGQPNVSDQDISDHFTAMKTAAIESYTLCGRQADWSNQASHFVAAATAACLSPSDQAEQCKNLAWTAAMNARMARVCENIANGVESDNSEAHTQYQILAEFLNGG